MAALRRQRLTCAAGGGKSPRSERRTTMLKIIAGIALCRAGRTRKPGAARRTGRPGRSRVIVPCAAGGPVDTIARIMTARMSEIARPAVDRSRTSAAPAA